MDLLKQSGESLAGRIAYIEMGPFMSSKSPLLATILPSYGRAADFEIASWPRATPTA